MKTAVLFALLVACVLASDVYVDQAFQKWRVDNHKFYSNNQEYEKRKAIFGQTLKWIEQFNSEEHSYEVGLNQFSDLTDEEFYAMYTMNTLPEGVDDAPLHVEQGLSAPSKDHRAEGCVNPVKNQGQCGSCWSFGANAAMECAWKKAGHALTQFSEQNLVDCDHNSHGCNGGWHYYAMDYVIRNNGIASAAKYPYVAQTRSCTYDSSMKAGSISKRYQVSNTESAMLDAATSHVLAVAVYVSTGFRNYRSGVFDGGDCGSNNVNHAVSVVGYGTENGKDYWIVRNSWASSWGDGGYIKMARGKDTCKIRDYVYYAV